MARFFCSLNSPESLQQVQMIGSIPGHCLVTRTLSTTRGHGEGEALSKRTRSVACSRFCACGFHFPQGTDEFVSYHLKFSYHLTNGGMHCFDSSELFLLFSIPSACYFPCALAKLLPSIFKLPTLREPVVHKLSAEESLTVEKNSWLLEHPRISLLYCSVCSEWILECALHFGGCVFPGKISLLGILSSCWIAQWETLKSIWKPQLWNPLPWKMS